MLLSKLKMMEGWKKVRKKETRLRSTFHIKSELAGSKKPFDKMKDSWNNWFDQTPLLESDSTLLVQKQSPEIWIIKELEANLTLELCLKIQRIDKTMIQICRLFSKSNLKQCKSAKQDELTNEMGCFHELYTAPKACM